MFKVNNRDTTTTPDNVVYMSLKLKTTITQHLSHESCLYVKFLKKYLIACAIQRRTMKPVKHPRWSFLRKYLTTFSRFNYFRKKLHDKCINWVLNTPPHYIHTYFCVLFVDSSETRGALFYVWVCSLLISTLYTLMWDLKMDWGLLSKDAGENKFLREQIVYEYKVKWKSKV